MEYAVDPGLSVGTQKDIPIITRLVNAAFQGGSESWTHLPFCEATPRTDEKEIKRLMEMTTSAFIMYTNDSGVLVGCLFLEDIGDKKFHLWLMAVDPTQQNQGIGKKLLTAAVKYGRERGFKLIEFTTSAMRPAVVAWYERCGFTKTGKLIDFDLSTIMPVEKGKIIQEVEFVKYL